MDNFSIQIKKQKPKLINSIIALGSPIVDILAEIDENDISKYNLKKDEATFANNVNRQFYNDIIGKSHVLEIPGGSAPNILRAISWSLMNNNINLNEQKKLSMLGCVGNDTFKNKIINSLKDYKINTELLEQINMETSKCAVGIYDHRRYFLSELSASKCLSDNFVTIHWDKIISHDALLIEGYFLGENFNLANAICREFYEKGKYIIFTLSDPSMIKQYRDQVITIANMADMIVGNVKEAKNLIQEENDIRMKDLFQRIYSLLNNKTRIIIITAGAHGVFCSKYDSITRIENNFQSFSNKINSDEIKDYNGAGDAFLGGFLSQQMMNKTFEDCCRLGNNVAAVVIKNYGCNFPNINSNSNNILIRN